MQAIDPAGKIRSLACDAAGRLITTLAAPIEQRVVVGAVAVGVWAYTPEIDLGPVSTRQHTRLIAAWRGVSSVGTQVDIQCSDDGVIWYSFSPSSLGSSTSQAASVSTSNPNGFIQAVAFARYARVSYYCGATPQTALFLALTALAGI